MRLSKQEIDNIKNVISVFDPNAVVYLFGSRVYDNKRGGDIDLLVFSEKITFDMRRQIKIRLYDCLGEQKIDILLAKDTDDPFVRIAMKEGVRLRKQTKRLY